MALRFISFIVGWSIYSISFSQSLSPTVVGFSGNDVSNSTVQLSWTLGEPIIKTHHGITTVLTQGFHQTYIEEDEDTDTAYTCKIYPIPTTDFITIEFCSTSTPYTIYLYDIIGRLILLKETASVENETLSLSQFEDATYILKVTNNLMESTETVKIQKIK